MRWVMWWSVCAAACAADPRVDAILALDGDAQLGSALYGEHCATCHGEDGTGGTHAGIAHPHGSHTTIVTILDGNNVMPAFDGTLDDAEIAHVHEFLEQDIFEADDH